jgi:hypothetical protein
MRDIILQKMYNDVPNLCKVPPNFCSAVISKIFIKITLFSINRRKAVSCKHSSCESNSNSNSADSKLVKRCQRRSARREDKGDCSSVISNARRSHSCVTPIVEYP